MDDGDQNKERGRDRRPAPGTRSSWAAFSDALGHFSRRMISRIAPIAPQHPAIDDELERLHDLKWQISDSARRYRDLLDAQAGLIVRRDAQGRVVFANRAYLAAFGFNEDEIAGRPHEPHVLATEPGHANRIAEQIETVNGPRWIEWDESAGGVSPAGEAETQRTGRDITDERRAALELRLARDAALEASRAKSRFLATMSHEIRTPMNGILGMTDLLLDGPLTGDQTLYAQTIGQSARALMTLIDEILDFSRIEAGKLVLTEAPFDLCEMIGACVALLEPKASDKGLEMHWRAEGEVPSPLIGDEARVRQIVLNLLSNAVKFTDAGAVRVTVGVADTASPKAALRVLITVEDTGIGLSAAECEAIFAEFEQAEAAVRRQDGGSGLGLAIARRIARAMNGDVRAVSEPGRGSVFTAEVFLQRPDKNAAALRTALGRAALANAKESGGAGADAQKPRVLVAEDNAVNALLATRLLERSGCLVVRVATGDEAVAAVARSLAGQEPPFDLVLMDIYMPRLNGVEATRGIRRLLAASTQPRLPIVAVTANAFAEDRQRYLAAGLDDYLAKPFDGEALRAIVARWLGPHRRQSPAA